MTNKKKTTALTSLAAQAFGRLGGSQNTAAQNAARAKNAQFAGRPRRVCLTCGEPVRGHVDRALDITCGPHGWRWLQGAKAPTAIETMQQLLFALQRVEQLHEQLGPPVTPFLRQVRQQRGLLERVLKART